MVSDSVTSTPIHPVEHTRLQAALLELTSNPPRSVICRRTSEDRLRLLPFLLQLSR